MTSDQVRAARELLGWSRRRLGARSGVSFNVVKVLEQDGRAMASFIRTEQVDALAAIRAAFETAGIEFTGGDAPEARLLKVASTE